MGRGEEFARRLAPQYPALVAIADEERGIRLAPSKFLRGNGAANIRHMLAERGFQGARIQRLRAHTLIPDESEAGSLQ